MNDDVAIIAVVNRLVVTAVMGDLKAQCFKASLYF